MADTNYLGLGVVFRAVDDKFSSTMEIAKSQVRTASMSLSNLQAAIDSVRESIHTPMGMNDFIDADFDQIDSALVKMGDSHALAVDRMLGNQKDLDLAFGGSSRALVKTGGASGSLGDEFDTLAKKKDALIENFQWLSRTLDQAKIDVDDVNKSTKLLGSGMNQASASVGGFSGFLGRLGKHGKSVIGGLGNGFIRLGQSVASMAFIKDQKPFQTLLVGTQEIPEFVKGFDNLQQRMMQIYDPNQVKSFMSANFQNLKTMGVGADKAMQMANTLNQFGVSLRDANQALPMMGEMVGALGMDAQQVATMFGQSTRQLRMMPKDMVGVVKEVNRMGAAFNLLDFTEDLPEVVAGVSDSLFKLGRMNRDNARQAIQSAMAIKAQYQLLGMSSKEATAAAKDFQGGLSGMERSIRRMGAGLEPLSDDIFELMPELVRVTGKSAQEIYSMIQQGATDPKAFQDFLLAEGKKLGGTDLTRFTEIVREKFGSAGDAIANAIINPTQLEQATAEANAKMEEMDPNKQWSKMLAASKDTFSFHEKLLQANKDLLEIQKDFAIKSPMLKTINAQIDGLQNLQAEMSDSSSALYKMITALNAFEKGGLSALSIQSGFEKLGETFGKFAPYAQQFSHLGIALGMLSGAFGFLAPIGKMLTSAISGLGSLTSRTWGFITAGKGLAGVGQRFKTLGSFVGGTIKTFGRLAKAGGIIGSVLAFVPDAMDAVEDFKQGNYGKGIMTTLLGDAKSSVLGQAAKWGGVGATIGTFVAPGIGTAIGGGIGAAVGAVGKIVKDNWEPIEAWLKSVPEKMGYAVGASMTWIQTKFNSVYDWIDRNFFDAQVWSQRWGTVKAAATSAFDWMMGIPDRLWEVLKKIPDMITQVFKEIPGQIQSAWKGTTGWVGGVLDKITNKFSKGMDEGSSAILDKEAAKYLSGPVTPQKPKSMTPPEPTGPVAPLPKNVIPMMDPGIRKEAEESLRKYLGFGSFLKKEGIQGKYAFGKSAVHGAEFQGPKSGLALEKFTEANQAFVKLQNMMESGQLTGDQFEILKKNAAPTEPVLDQPGAPLKSALPVMPKYEEDKSSKDILDIVTKTKDEIVSKLDKLAEKPVVVTLQGDAKRLFKAVDNMQKESGGLTGNLR